MGTRGWIFALRRLVASIPYGTEPGTLPHESSDVGGRDDATLSELVCAGGESVWLRDTRAGTIFRVNLRSRSVARLELGEGRSVWTIGMVRTHNGELAALTGYRDTPTGPAAFRVSYYDQAQVAAKRVVNLGTAAGAPLKIGVMDDDSIWVSDGPTTRVFDPAGAPRASVPGSGLALPGGWFLTDGEAPVVYDRERRVLATLRPPSGSGRMRFLAAGPSGSILARGNPARLPRAWSSRVGFVDVYSFDPEGYALKLEDRITAPGFVLKTWPDGKLRDATPVVSYFPLEAADFDESGSVVHVELTDVQCNFYLCARLKADDPWTWKFAHPEDLNREELEIARAEWRLRAGTGRPPTDLAAYFEGFDIPRPSRALPGENALAIDRLLNTSRPRRP